MREPVNVVIEKPPAKPRVIVTGRDDRGNQVRLILPVKNNSFTIPFRLTLERIEWPTPPAVEGAVTLELETTADVP